MSTSFVTRFPRSVRVGWPLVLSLLALFGAFGLVRALPVQAAPAAPAPRSPLARSALSPAGSGMMSGTITTPAGAPIADVQVTAYFHGSGGWYVTSAQSDAAGHYLLGGLESGSYDVGFNAQSQGYIPEFYDDQPTIFQASGVTVEDGELTANVNASLDPYSTITGRVTGDNGQPIGAVVNAYRRSGDDWFVVQQTWAGESGHYTLTNLLPGAFRLHFSSPLPYQAEFFADRPSLEMADPLTLTPGLVLTGIDATLAPYGALQGRATTIHGYPIGSVQVTAMISDSAGWVPGPTTWTGVDGRYTLPLAAGHYRLRFSTPSQPYADEFYDNQPTIQEALALTVTPGVTLTGLNTVLEGEAASISGRLTERDGPAGGVDVTAYRYASEWGSWEAIRETRSDATGNYALVGLAPGDYALKFSAPYTYHLEYFNDKPSLDQADLLSVAAGQDRSGTDALLTRPGAISGTVTGANGLPLPGVYVEASSPTTFDGAEAWTDAAGRYLLRGLPTGSYLVAFTDHTGAYRNEYYDNQTEAAAATPIAVSDDQTTPNINAALSEYGGIYGTTLSDAGTPIAGIRAVAAISTTSSWHEVGFSETDDQGHYHIKGLNQGDYRLLFRDSMGRYATTYYNGRAAVEQADPISVTLGQQTGPLTVTLLPRGTISGTVTAADGAPLANIEVVATHWESWESQAGTTDAAGHYLITGLDTAPYLVRFTDPTGAYVAEYYDDHLRSEEATPITVTGGVTISGINAALERSGTIAGFVRTEDGAPASAQITLYHETQVGWDAAHHTTSNAEGFYQFAGLLPGHYRLGFSGQAYQPEFYNDQPTLESAHPLTITYGAVLTDVSATLKITGHITGRVTAPDGSPIQGVVVTFYTSPDGGTTWEEDFHPVGTDSNGVYRVVGLATGTYRLGFLPPHYPPYLPEFYPDAADIDHAQDIPVTFGEVTGGIDATLTLAGSLTGRVADAESQMGLEGIEVTAYQARQGQWVAVRTTTTDMFAQYRFERLASGSYRIGFHQQLGPYLPEFWNDQPTIEQATPIEVVGGETTSNVDALLVRGPTGRLLGRLVSPEGTPLTGAMLSLYTETPAGWRPTPPIMSEWPDGTFAYHELPPGRYRLGISNLGGFPAQFYNRRLTLAEADDILVEADSDTTLTVVPLPQSTITGTVTNPGGEPLEGITILVLTPSGDGVHHTTTDASGSYALPSLADGPYILRFSDPAGHYATEFFSDHRRFDESEPIQLRAGSVQRANAVLEPRGVLAGRVTNQAGTPLAGISVGARTRDGDERGVTVTDDDGHYALRLDGADELLLEFSAPHTYARRFYPNNPTSRGATELLVTPAITRTGLHMVLLGAGAISGTVTSQAGLPLEQVQVSASMWDGGGWSSVGGAMTDEAGRYHIQALPPGTHQVGFGPTGGDHAGEFYPDKRTAAGANDVVVQPGATTVGIDAALSPGGMIRGTIRSWAGQGLDDMVVTLYALEGGSWQRAATAPSDWSGGYRFPALQPGHYRVGVADPTGEYLPRFYPAAASLPEASDVEVVVGQTTASINLVMLDSPRISFSHTHYAGSEASGAIPVTVTLHAAPPLTVTVTLRGAHRQAHVGSDYPQVSATLTFPPGVQSLMTQIPIIDDAQTEATESFLVSLRSPVNGSLIAPYQALLTIHNDDEPCTDLDGSGTTDVLDIQAIAAHWGQPADLPYDLNVDGTITIADIAMLTAHFGQGCG